MHMVYLALNFAAAQALDFRNHNFGKGVKIAHKVIRKKIEFLDIDRPLYNDHNTIKEVVKSCEILKEVELSLGEIY